MTGNRAYSIEIFGATRGRHRLGRPGLRHCRQLSGVRRRLSTGQCTRHRLRRSPADLARGATAVAVAVAVAAAVVLSGWYTAAGATAIAQMVAP
jgi:hypothetical protein